MCWYGTKVGVGLWEGPSHFPHYAVRHTKENIRHLVQVGADPPAVVAEECHRHGMRMVARLSPALALHREEEFREGGGVYYNRFTQSHPEMTIQRVDPALAGWGARPGQMLDFTYPEVREQLLKSIRELAESYDVDGIDLFYRGGGPFFEADEAVKKAPIMTDFIRRVRHALDEAAQKRGRSHLLLCAGVPDSPEWALQVGLDVGAWIQEGLLDIVMPSRSHGLDFEAPVDKYAALCQGRQCQVLPVLQPGIPPHSTPYPLAQLRAAADNFFRLGADGLATFNFNHRYHGSLGNGSLVPLGEAISWLAELKQPQKVASGIRVYPCYRIHDYTRLERPRLSFAATEVGVRKIHSLPRIPALGVPGSQRRLRFKAQESAWDDVLEVDIDGKPLVLRQREFDMNSNVRAAISGKPHQPIELEKHVWPSYAFEFEVPALATYKEMGVRLVKRGNVRSEIKIQDVEIVIFRHS